MSIKIEGQLELDLQRGVIYFHSDKGTVLRLTVEPDIPHPYGPRYSTVVEHLIDVNARDFLSPDADHERKRENRLHLRCNW